MRLPLIITMMCCAFTASAIMPDPATRMHSDLRGIRAGKTMSRAEDLPEEEPAPYRPVILKVDDPLTVDTLLAMDVIIYHRRDDLLLTSIPRDSLVAVLSLGGIVDAASTASMNATLDRARPFNSVDRVQAPPASPGSPLTRAYTGDGVVVGFSDIGFDPHHIEFDGRVAAVYAYNTPHGLRHAADTPALLYSWVTDDPENYHATHVCGILAGGYLGNPYYGAATGAEIVGTTSHMYDVGILSGVEDVIAYAKDHDKRAVVNLSLSSHLGAHDGTSLLCQYLSRCAEDAVICISAGNSGTINCFADQTLEAGDEAAVTVNNYRTWDGFQVSGYTDIWSDSDAPLELSLQVYDTDANRPVWASDWTGGEGYTLLTDTVDDGWNHYMSGMLYAEYGLSRLNGRYNICVYYDTQTEEVSSRGNWSKYLTCIRVRKARDAEGGDQEAAPTYVMFFSDATQSYLGTVPGVATEVSTRGSINEMCTARGVIGVGMACSRTTTPTVSGVEQSWGGTVGEIVKYSAYSDTPGIKPLPLISAAGYYVVSAANGEYVLLHPDQEYAAVATVDGIDYYWIATGGTSMSSPLVAGIIAQWLEADPTLTVDEIIDIMQSTATRDYPGIGNPRWGAGNIDAYAGICEVLRRTGTVAPRMPVDISVGADRRLQLRGVSHADVRLYTVAGIPADPASTLAPGVYIVSAPGLDAVKLVVR